ncbi:PD-(D/E)XK nuclease family protein [Spirulina subsalsa FACHB-351]|uniref:PD-(D/E)XK nuclease family protein n=1 Tax=Spirulina subsalsa FACHB-351 TaxID=234711 RepID=A0ABT3L586_9CYAN|nr:PD-(D/E)XK nuclease family protein [Spirulina subsalsa]MCW6036678.1 PD-(D/E)XK nuclease family protein [Spirulina subsalsa FACHB-351]
MLRLNQSHLTKLETCPRQFQHSVLEQFLSPVSPDLQEKAEWGKHFHLLMQQQELGLPLSPLLEQEQEMGISVISLLNATHERLLDHPERWQEAEHARTLQFEDFLLTVVYDLLITQPNQGEIFDWKTYPKPKKHKLLAQEWQTKLYLFVLAETSHYQPEQLSMTYWFVQSRTASETTHKTPIQSARIAYNVKEHEATRHHLKTLLNQLKQDLENYERHNLPFPQVAEEKGICPRCIFAHRCQRNGDSVPGNSPRESLFVDLDQIAELPI